MVTRAPCYRKTSERPNAGTVASITWRLRVGVATAEGSSHANPDGDGLNTSALTNPLDPVDFGLHLA